MNISKEDYLKLLQDLANEQYDSEDKPEVIPDDTWIPADPPAKERMKNISFSGVVDATNLRKDQVKSALARASNIKVGAFLIRINDYCGKDPLQKGILSFEIYERRTRTPTGNPCNMDYPADLSADDRFHGRPWLSYFSGASARDVPIDTIIDIVRWMQAVKKLSAFL